jgi:hypothetical protein
MGDNNETADDYSCSKWETLFSNFNHYFRDDAVINGTEHASVPTGVAIFCLYSFVIAFGACGNLLTFSAVIRNPAMRTNRNVSLSLHHSCMCIDQLILVIHRQLGDVGFLALHRHRAYDAVHRHVLLLAVRHSNVQVRRLPPRVQYIRVQFFDLVDWLGQVSAYLLVIRANLIMLLRTYRYVVIIFPTKRDRQRHFMFFCFAFIWLISFGLAVPLLIASDIKELHHDPQCNLFFDICHEQNNIWQDMIVKKEVYTIAVMATQYCLPLASLVFVYSQIASRMGARIRGRPVLQTNNDRRR